MNDNHIKNSCVPYAVYESAMARSAQDKRRWNIALVASTLIATIVVAVSLIANNILWQKHEIKILGD